MTSTGPQSAILAARAAVWTWRSSGAQISIHGGRGASVSELNGDWTLNALLSQFDGLSRGRLDSLLQKGAPGEGLDETVQLQSGVEARFVGSFIDQGVAHGLIYTDENTHAHDLTSEEELEPVYQTIHDVKTGRVVGFEALARWRREDGQLCGPDDLDLIGLTPDWAMVGPAMLKSAAAALSHFRELVGDVFMQVNLSAAEISRAKLVDEAATAISGFQFPRGVLRVELTEQAALRDADRALGALAALRAAGAGLILDDFGAGHSSLAWLVDIPADGVKLDPKLTSLISRPRGFKVISAMIGLAHELKLSVTAEGVETDAQARALRDAKCDYVQGWLYGAPLLEADMSALLQQP